MSKLKIWVRRLISRVEELERRLQMLDDRLSHVHDVALCSAAEQAGERDDGQGQQEPEEPKPLLTGPCIAKTRAGDVVRVERSLHQNYQFDYRNACSGPRWSVDENGRLSGIVKEDRDIVEVIRPLSEKEVLDWQFRGIEPELNVPSDVVAEGFEHSDVGRKEAEAMGLVYLGRATGESVVPPGDGQFYEFSSRSMKWFRALDISPFKFYAFKPNPTQ